VIGACESGTSTENVMGKGMEEVERKRVCVAHNCGDAILHVELKWAPGLS
jgi:hypothetical protein